MAKPIDSVQLKSLAKDIKGLLDVYGIEMEMFTLGVRVPSEFYRAVKENFPERHEIDMSVGSGEEDWHINLICSPFASPTDDE